MILVGRYRSPFGPRALRAQRFCRRESAGGRVAATMNLYGIPYERQVLSAVTDGAAIRAVNPLGRVPALIFDSGETLIESAAILDYLDECAAPGRALVPPKGAERREVLKWVAYAIGAAEKAVAFVYEHKRRPQHLICPEWADYLRAQARAGLAELDKVLGADKPWLALGRLTQADVSAVATWDFLGDMLPGIFAPGGVGRQNEKPGARNAAGSINFGVFAPGEFPRLAALAERANRMPAFAETHPSLDN